MTVSFLAKKRDGASKNSIFSLALYARLSTLKNGGLNWSYHNSADKRGEFMAKTNVRIGAFEIDDAELHGEQQGERTLSIPCKSDPDLCMQLDAWDADDQRIRHGGCFPVEDFIDSFWLPAREYSDF